MRYRLKRENLSAWIIGLAIASVVAAPSARAHEHGGYGGYEGGGRGGEDGPNVSFGIAGGINFSEGVTTTLDPDTFFLEQMALTGFSYTGAVSLSLFQQSVVGIGLGLDYLHLSLSDNGVTFNGNALIASALINFNFNYWRRHHNLGVGYGYWDMLNYSVSNTPNGLQKRGFGGFAFVGKDYLTPETTGGFFLASKIFYASSSNSFSPFLTISLLLGYDF